MKSVLVSALMVVNTSAALAAGGHNLPAYVNQCEQAAIAKLENQASVYGATLDVNTVAVAGIDDRPLNPYKYVWFSAIGHTEKGDIQLQVLTQKGPFRKCF